MAALAAIATAGLLLQYFRLQRVTSLLQRIPTVRAAAASTPVAIDPAPIPAAPPAQMQPDSIVPPRDTPRRAWSGELKVVQIMPETPTVKSFRLVEPSGSALPFDYLPGQFMQVELTAHDRKLRRAYTIASSPTRRAYAELTVKRAGEVSQHLHDQIKVGDIIKVSAPYGDFTFTGMDEESIVLIGGGVGVTPLMSVVRYLTDLAWPGQIFFVYSARSTEEFVFRYELEFLQRRHPNLHVLAAMARSEGTTWMGPEGLITKDLLQSGVPEIARRRVHVCGPPPMMTAMKQALDELGVPKERIHTEAFGPASMPADSLPPAAPSAALAARVAATKPSSPPPLAPAPAVAEHTVVFARSGKSAGLAAGATVLDAAEAVGVDIPWTCRTGICGTCKTKLLEGTVTMDVEDALSAEEKASGLILACQAKSAGGNLVVDA